MPPLWQCRCLVSVSAKGSQASTNRRPNLYPEVSSVDAGKWRGGGKLSVARKKADLAAKGTQFSHTLSGTASFSKTFHLTVGCSVKTEPLFFPQARAKRTGVASHPPARIHPLTSPFSPFHALRFSNVTLSVVL